MMCDADTHLSDLLAECREALEDMCQQFAYPGEGPVLITGGLSALECAFRVLGWEDPHPVPERGCDEPGCRRMATCGTPVGGGYRTTCSEHARRRTQR